MMNDNKNILLKTKILSLINEAFIYTSEHSYKLFLTTKKSNNTYQEINKEKIFNIFDSPLLNCVKDITVPYSHSNNIFVRLEIQVLNYTFILCIKIDYYSRCYFNKLLTKYFELNERKNVYICVKDIDYFHLK